MKRKMRIVKLYNISVWVIIAFLFSYVLMKSYVIYAGTDKNQKIMESGKDFVAEFTNHMIWSSSPILQYVKAEEDGENQDNILVRFVNRIFPLGQYAQYAWNDSLEKENSAYRQAARQNGLEFNYTDIFDDSENTTEVSNGNPLDNISFIHGESYMEESKAVLSSSLKSALLTNKKQIAVLQDTLDFGFLIKNFYIVDSTTNVTSNLFNPSKLLKKDMTIKQDSSKPQILIYHTHSQESFADSKKGVQGDTVVGVGDYLTDLLSNKYGYNVIHDTGCYDLVDGVLDRSKAYSYSLSAVEKILKNNPSIEVVIDLHRDGVNGDKKSVCLINGKETAQVMFFNGLSRNQKGAIDYLFNPNIQSNLAFSLQLHMKSMSRYPDFTKKIYLKSYRYNLHLKPKSLLIELGNQNSTVSEAKNAMEPLAEILDQTLNGE